jgi:hypothetical protein
MISQFNMPVYVTLNVGNIAGWGVEEMQGELKFVADKLQFSVQRAVYLFLDSGTIFRELRLIPKIAEIVTELWRVWNAGHVLQASGRVTHAVVGPGGTLSGFVLLQIHVPVTRRLPASSPEL